MMRMGGKMIRIHTTAVAAPISSLKTSPMKRRMTVLHLKEFRYGTTRPQVHSAGITTSCTMVTVILYTLSKTATKTPIITTILPISCFGKIISRQARAGLGLMMMQAIF